MCNLPLEFNDPVREIIHPNPEQDIILAPGGGYGIDLYFEVLL